MSTLDEKRYAELARSNSLAGDPLDEMSDALDVVGFALDELQATDRVQTEDIEAAALGLIHLKEWLVKALDAEPRSNEPAIDELETNAMLAGQLHGMTAGWVAVADEEGPFMALGAKGQPHTSRGSSPRNTNPHVVCVFGPNGDALGVALRSNGEVVALEVIR